MTPETFGHWFYMIFCGAFILGFGAYVLYWIGYLLLALTAALVEGAKALATVTLRLTRRIRPTRS
ncbi:hypothetical protein AB0F17_34310 [Nonomuraea sp. NPDC026600]|uniref:hypothetical protein n=1 Tax=Nonomuraea sp. NPDC026600 TaxID=3155363 RepID=UPI0033E14711